MTPTPPPCSSLLCQSPSCLHCPLYYDYLPLEDATQQVALPTHTHARAHTHTRALMHIHTHKKKTQMYRHSEGCSHGSQKHRRQRSAVTVHNHRGQSSAMKRSITHVCSQTCTVTLWYSLLFCAYGISLDMLIPRLFFCPSMICCCFFLLFFFIFLNLFCTFCPQGASSLHVVFSTT